MQSRLLVFFFLLITPGFGIAKTINIGIIIDGSVKRETLPIEQIKHEIIELNKGEFDIVFPADKRINAGWQLDKIKTALDQLGNDNEVDLIITQGLLSSHLAGHFKQLKKPVIAPIVADRVLQNLPYQNGRSGKHNFSYVNASSNVEQDLRQFYRLTPFKHLLIPVDPVILKAMPFLRSITSQVQRDLGFELTFLPVATDLQAILQQIPETADAVYLPPHMRFDQQQLKLFADGLIQRKLPSFSLLGREDLNLGFMATLHGRPVDSLRFSRRIALMVQSILLGADAGNLKVDLAESFKLAINMRTAKAIGFSPKWRDLEVAELLFVNDNIEARHFSLPDAVTAAVSNNLTLQSNQLEIELAKDQVKSAHSALLPQLSISVNGAHINQSRAGIQQSQRSADASVTAKQLIYSESSWSNYDVAELLKQAEDARFKSRTLNLISQTATAYLSVLSALATEKIRQANLKVSETNLELALIRLRIGYSDRSEALRWKSVIASDRSALYFAESSREQLETELKRLIHLPLKETLSVTDKGIIAQMTLLQAKRFLRFFDNAVNFNHFINFEVERAMNNSPELEQFTHLLASAKRQLDASNRAYYVPDVSVNAQFNQNISQGGIGAGNSQFQKDDWSVGFQTSLPLFTSGARSAQVSRASHSLIQTRYQREDMQESIEARVRTALQKAKGSFPAIRLSKDAAVAARENFTLVSESYASGVVSITSLIDAQNAALSADLSAIDALYTFMIDWMEIQRAVANFDLLLSEQGIENWYQALEEYYRKNR